MDAHLFRFSRDRWFGGRISFLEFLEHARDVRTLAKSLQMHPEISVLTCEDWTTYDSTVTLDHQVVREALKNRKSYALGDLTREVWDSSFSTEANFRNVGSESYSILTISCDRRSEPNRILFYGQAVNDALYLKVAQTFKRFTLRYRVGHGDSMPSAFNAGYGEYKLRSGKA